MRYYGIFVADPRQPADRLVDRRVNKQAARELVARLNEAELKRRQGEPVNKVPLYYCCRDDENGEIS